MIEQLARRGYGYGSGMLSPDCSQFIVSMPKNASSYLVDWASRHRWSSAMVGDSCDWHLVKQTIVILRDPLDRWISGMAQYLNTYILHVAGPNGPIFNLHESTVHDGTLTADDFITQYNQLTERLIFDQISRFDDHTWPQVELFENILPDVDRKYFYLDQTFNQTIADYLHFEPYNDLDRNSKEHNKDIKKLQEFLLHRLNIRPELKQRIVDHYARDYKIIQQIFNQ